MKSDYTCIPDGKGRFCLPFTMYFRMYNLFVLHILLRCSASFERKIFCKSMICKYTSLLLIRKEVNPGSFWKKFLEQPDVPKMLKIGRASCRESEKGEGRVAS